MEENNKLLILIILVIMLINLALLVGCSENHLADDMKNYEVSGYVSNFSESGRGVEGISLNFSNGQGKVITDDQGQWQKIKIKGKTTITPIKKGYSFEPEQTTVSRPQNEVNFVVVTNNNDQTPPVKSNEQPVEWYINQTKGDQRLASGDEVDIYFSEAMDPDSKVVIKSEVIKTFGNDEKNWEVIQSKSGLGFYIKYSGEQLIDISGGKELNFPPETIEDAHGVKNKSSIQFLIKDYQDIIPPTKAEIEPFSWYVNDVPGDETLTSGDEFELYFSEEMSTASLDIVKEEAAATLGVNNGELDIIAISSGVGMSIKYLDNGSGDIDLSGGRELVLAAGSVADVAGNSNEVEIRYIIADK